MTSIGELTLGPFPCQLSPGGNVFFFFFFTECVGSWMGQARVVVPGQGSKPAGLIN